MKIIYFAHNIRGYVCLRTLIDNDFNVKAVVFQEDPSKNEYNAKMEKLSKGENIKCFIQKNPNNVRFVSMISALNPDIFVLAGYGGILGRRILSVPSLISINLHGGKLPDFRGASVINWQILKGKKRIGLSIIEVDKGIDTGPILCKCDFPLSENEDFNDALAKSLALFPGMLMETLRKIENNKLKKIKQAPGEGSYYFKRHPKDGKIDWRSTTAKDIVNLIRAVAPPACPGAFSFIKNKKIILARAALIKKKVFSGQPGRAGSLFVENRKRGRLVFARDGAVLIEKIFEEKKRKILDVPGFIKIGDLLT